ncbi:MAG: hypothetical protein JWP74_885 [Marmoricola sp.]|nr:hypothetical protein [Marmoricola sp.]
MSRARAFHLLTFLVATFAIVLQLVLVIQGHKVLDEAHRIDPGTRLVRFVSYLTIWSNVLVAATTLTLALGVDRDSRIWRALRLDAVVICFGGGVVHFFLLRPLLNLHGWDLVADKLLHLVVPLLALIGWLAFGPRRRASTADLVPFLVVPVFWLAYTLVRGSFVNWYPYPFLDVGEHGYGIVALYSAGVSVLMLSLAAGAVRLDRLLAGWPAP